MLPPKKWLKVLLFGHIITGSRVGKIKCEVRLPVEGILSTSCRWTVNGFLKMFSGFEAYHPACWDAGFFTGFGVTAYTRSFLAYLKRTKTS